MKCKYYTIDTKLIGLPSDKMLAGPPRVIEYEYCNLYNCECHSCKGDVINCFQSNRAIEAKRQIKDYTNREWTRSLNNEELAVFIESKYFQNIVKHPLISLRCWFDKKSNKSEKYLEEL